MTLEHACMLTRTCVRYAHIHTQTYLHSHTLHRLHADAGVFGAPPSARFSHAMASVGNKVFVHGGSLEGDDVLSDELWEYNILALEWKLLAANVGVTGTPPSARFRHAMSKSGTKLMVFGGDTGLGRSGELFVFDTVMLNWLQLSISGWIPSARSGHAMTSIGTKLVLFGGKTGSLIGDYSNELWEFDNMEWNLRVGMPASDPWSRHDHVLASLGSQIFLHGGFNGSHRLDDLLITVGGKTQDWPAVGETSFTRIYDGDTILINKDTEWNWSTTVDLCSKRHLPCSLKIMGDPASLGKIFRHGSGVISCKVENGCSAMVLHEVQLVCNKNILATAGPLQISGAVLILEASTFSDCHSIEDGGAIRVYNQARVRMVGSTIERSSSQG